MGEKKRQFSIVTFYREVEVIPIKWENPIFQVFCSYALPLGRGWGWRFLRGCVAASAAKNLPAVVSE